jgi:N-acetylneuraminate synthase
MTPCFIAEVSSNHHRDLGRCLQFIDTAAETGCDGVKFQLFKIDELFAPEILAKSQMHRQRKKWELPLAFLPDLAAHCRDKGLFFSCTPFYLAAVEELYPFVDFYKIASYELLWDDLLTACARTGKPVVLSTGMATLPEIAHAVDVILKAFPRNTSPVVRECGLPSLTLLHCVSGYPVPEDQCNLAVIETLRHCAAGQSNTINVGWSDHSVSMAVIFRAVNQWHASMIEFHLDLDGKGEEFDSGHCWLPEQMGRVIAQIRKYKPEIPGHSPISENVMDGNGKKQPAPVELADRDWRADPSDGLRPLKRIRTTWNG